MLDLVRHRVYGRFSEVYDVGFGSCKLSISAASPMNTVEMNRNEGRRYPAGKTGERGSPGERRKAAADAGRRKAAADPGRKT